MSPLERLTAALADRYRIERELGAGGMATVYLAEDLKHHREVALKVLHPDLVASLGAERFLREIDVTAHLQHPHILPLYDSGQADKKRRYMASEFLLLDTVCDAGHLGVPNMSTVPAPLAAGGMASVHLAEDLRHHRKASAVG